MVKIVITGGDGFGKTSVAEGLGLRRKNPVRFSAQMNCDTNF